MSAAATPHLSDAQIVEVLGLLQDADSVELKLTVPAAGQRSSIEALGFDPLDAQVRLIYFFDTPDLALSRAGVVVRARRIARKGEDSVVKLRPVVPDALPKKLRADPGFGVEVDAMPGGFVCSGRLRVEAPSLGVGDAAAGTQPLHKLFSKQQRALFADHAPAGVALDALTTLGPIFILKLKGTPPGFKSKLVAELWLFPDGSRILELSTKCLPSEAFQVAAETRARLTEHGISLSGDQETKTRRALELFSSAPK
ncbi:MAG: adenylate cyclase [Actinomycetota bacterium]|nr:adenylate cyclase [Actinomycetota bacterium]